MQNSVTFIDTEETRFTSVREKRRQEASSRTRGESLGAGLSLLLPARQVAEEGGDLVAEVAALGKRGKEGVELERVIFQGTGCRRNR
jgi:hypothetical protein